jgi:PAS domain S-box-containing protein
MIDIVITFFSSIYTNISNVILLIHLIELIVIFGVGFLVFRRYERKDNFATQLSDKLEEVQELREEIQRNFNSLLDNTPCFIGVISSQYKFLMVNNEIAKATGIPKEHLLKDKCFNILGNGDVCPDCPTKKAFLTKSVCRNIKKAINIDDKEIYVEITSVPILGKTGNAKYVIEIARDITEQVIAEKDKENLFIQVIASLSKLIEKRDNATSLHSVRVENIAISIGKSMGLPNGTLKELSIAALLHDIGNIGVSEIILNKPSKLTNTEYALIKKHPTVGYEALINIELLKNIAEGILYHHEKFDGTGYPSQLKGDKIPVISKIISIADVWDALISDRPYRKAYSENEALQIMLQESISYFDPAIFSHFLKVICANNEPLTLLLRKLNDNKMD